MEALKKFDKRFRVDPGIHIEPFYQLEKMINKDMTYSRDCDNCPNCGGIKPNQNIYPSTSWCGVRTCDNCKRIIVINYSDRMGGATTDTVYVFNPETAKQ